MSASALILTYHAVGQGPAPLFVDRALLAAQLDCIAESGGCVLTVAALADALRAGTLPARAAAITFDDGFASVADAAPLLAERGFPATVFCVADHVGRRSDWASQPPWAPRLPLLGAAELRELVRAGWEVGSHGLGHTSLRHRTIAEIERELTESKLILEQTLESGVRSFAYPYGVVPRSGHAALSEAGYSAACT
ncbi:MAG: polysaccharide deacetylase family protein, partial [Actinomycetota bacterium]|nr:polysaccharide deacetylase family protein [Actinomycetota bacterium]